jgi:CheY-like chemotaxis protein
MQAGGMNKDPATALQYLISEYRLLHQTSEALLGDAVEGRTGGSLRASQQDGGAKEEEESNPVADCVSRATHSFQNFMQDLEEVVLSVVPPGQLHVPPMTHDAPEPRATSELAGKRCLLAIKDPEECLRFFNRVRAEGMTAHVARTAVQALARVASSTYDLVISEMDFPFMTGIEAVRRIRKYENRIESQRRLPPLSRSAFIVLVRNKYKSSNFSEAAIDAGADMCVESFDSIR